MPIVPLPLGSWLIADGGIVKLPSSVARQLIDTYPPAPGEIVSTTVTGVDELPVHVIGSADEPTTGALVRSGVVIVSDAGTVIALLMLFASTPPAAPGHDTE